MFNPLEFIKRKRQQRAARRLGMTALFRFQYDDQTVSGVLKDISQYGFSFASNIKLEPGEEIWVNITLDFDNVDQDLLNPDMEHYISLREKALIKWVRPNRYLSLGDYNVGCQFFNPDIEKLKILKHI